INETRSSAAGDARDRGLSRMNCRAAWERNPVPNSSPRARNTGTRVIDFYDMKIAAGTGVPRPRLGYASQPRGRRQGRIRSREGIMHHLATALIASIIAAVLSGIVFVLSPAHAAKLSDAERVALQKATAACKEEAKSMKFKWHWRKRQKYVKNCMI